MLKPLAGESATYTRLRRELLEAEIALVDQRERVARLRRELPLDTEVADHVFREGPRELDAGDSPIREVRLSQLFEHADRPLVLVHFMYGKQQQEPCPMCTMWADGYDGVAPHVSQRVNFGVLVAGDVTSFRAYARSRGWRHLRLLSAGESTLKRELGLEQPAGAQLPGVSVFAKRDGKLVHTYSCSAFLGEGHFRGMDLLCPTWHFLDLTPEGRGDWMPQRIYTG